MACCYLFWVNGLKRIPPVAKQPFYKMSPPQAPVRKSIDSYQFPLWTCPSLCPLPFALQDWVWWRRRRCSPRYQPEGLARPLSTYTKSPSFSRNLHCNCSSKVACVQVPRVRVICGRDQHAKTQQTGMSETQRTFSPSLSILKAKQASPVTPSSN